MFKLSTPDRLKHWHQFRDRLAATDLQGALEQTDQLWSKAPFTPFYLDVASPEDWPDPWTLIAENYYCDIAKALGILYTIGLSNHGENLPMELRVYSDPATRASYNLAVFAEGKYVINFQTGEIVNIVTIEQMLHLEHVFPKEKLKIY